jgi:hypothetical protein
MSADSVSTRFYPAGMLNTLSKHEVDRLHDASQGDLADLLRQCTLAVPTVMIPKRCSRIIGTSVSMSSP